MLRLNPPNGRHDAIQCFCPARRAQWLVASRANQRSAQPIWMGEKFGRSPALLAQSAAIGWKIARNHRPRMLCLAMQVHTALE